MLLGFQLVELRDMTLMSSLWCQNAHQKLSQFFSGRSQLRFKFFLV